MTRRPKGISTYSSHPYYIWAPAFRQSSGGIRALYFLCHALNECGYEAYVVTEQGRTHTFLRTPELSAEHCKRHREAGLVPIAVYPEVAPGNALAQSVIARWILNKPGHIGGDQIYAENELLFYWDDWVLEAGLKADRLTITIVDRSVFNNKPEISRQGFCYYANKFFKSGGTISPTLTANGIDVGQQIPRTPIELAQIFRSTELFYCYEPSTIAREAMACGCPVAFIETPYLKQFNWDKEKYFTIQESDIGKISPPAINIDEVNAGLDEMDRESWFFISNFIERTQAAAQLQAERQRTPEYQLQEAVNAFHSNEIERATNALSPLLEALPDNPLPPAYLAFICAAQGLSLEAQEFINRAMEIAPERADLKAALGECLLKAGQPGLAAEYLQEAVVLQPDMLSAYAALGRSMHLAGQSDMAIALLEAAAIAPSVAQGNIQTTHLEILAEQGNIADFSVTCLRYSRGLADDLLAVRCLSRFDAGGEKLVAALVSAQEKLVQLIPDGDPPCSILNTTAPPWLVAFLLSDVTREAQQGRLWALLRHLPPTQFMTMLIINDPLAADDPFAQACSLLADRTLVIADLDDAKALEQINANAPDILIDLDSYGPTDRLPVFARAAAGTKLLWGEAPMPALLPDCLPLQGEKIADQGMLPGVTLPGLGEYCELPDLPITPPVAPHMLGCLTPAIRIGPEGWRLFAEVLLANPESQLLLNLKDLGDSARQYISRQFEDAGVATTRLRFIHANTLEELCRHWQEVQLGLAPPVDGGDQALTTCLWMGRPFVALAGNLPWSHRPAALLDAVDEASWIADSPAQYVALTRQFPATPDARLRERMRAAGLLDPITFASGFAATMSSLLQAPPTPSP